VRQTLTIKKKEFESELDTMQTHQQYVNKHDVRDSGKLVAFGSILVNF